MAMEQYECFWGTCPHYVVAINKDGTAGYIGLGVAKRIGPVALYLPQSAFTRIVRKLEAINFSKLQRSYATKNDGCKEVWSDQSAVTFYVTRGSKTQTVNLYYGCKLPSVSDKLAALAQLIDQVTGISPLLGRGQ
ncbi:MAG: hypothetical protein EPN68_02075 [Rhodanobacter sp.]|nr:MAG: hypothetical protein EPN68_02075 [Rhodanobacter sp.]